MLFQKPIVMKYAIFFLLATMPNLNLTGQDTSPEEDPDITGKWVRISPAGPIAITFKTDGILEGDFGNDQSVEITSAYSIEGGHITFFDREGVACPEKGTYAIDLTDHYLALDLVEDNCAGRVRSTMGFWVRPDFKDLLAALSGQMEGSADPGDYLNRARMYLAVGRSEQARQDLDRYLEHHPEDARALVNRAGTRMPTDLQGVMEDCNNAIELDPDHKNAYFLRGLALYGLGKKEAACADFHRAVELGFTVLKEAEYDKCSEYWESVK
jgi:hypothetical protein